MAIYFTSDTHFWHKNVIGYCDRPWVRADGQPDVEAMNAALIGLWNKVVTPNDTVYHLGDFGMKKPEGLAAIRAALNGRIVLIRGNHDYATRKWLKAEDRVVGAFHQQQLVNATLVMGKVMLTHVPPLPFDGRYAVPQEPEGMALVLCGHVHEAWREAVSVRGTRIINVGADQWGYTPRTPEELQFDPKLLELDAEEAA